MKPDYILDRRTKDYKRISTLLFSKTAKIGYEQDIAKELVYLRFKDLSILFDTCEN